MDINFTNCLVDNKYLYGGKNGNKKGIIYNDSIYMLKFPSNIEKREESYSNSVISEYISCHIFESLGFITQETILGTYDLKSDTKIVVACKDFTERGYVLREFAELKNSIISTTQNGYGTDLEEVLNTIDEQELIPSNELKSFFWEMFIADALLGNFDRHNGNWGFLIHYETGDVKIAPIFDCGSCLYPQLNDQMIESILKNQEEIEKRIYIFPNSALKSDNDKINYFDYINRGQNADCNQALKTIVPKIDFQKINKIIDDTPYISEVRKEFYKTMILERYNKILLPAYQRLVETNN